MLFTVLGDSCGFSANYGRKFVLINISKNRKMISIASFWFAGMASCCKLICPCLKLIENATAFWLPPQNQQIFVDIASYGSRSELAGGLMNGYIDWRKLNLWATIFFKVFVSHFFSCFDFSRNKLSIRPQKLFYRFICSHRWRMLKGARRKKQSQ